MANSTAPVLAIGAITMANRSLFNGQSFDWKIPIATGIAVGMFALFEKALPDVAPMLAWTAVMAVVLTRVDPSVPSPAETALKWFNGIQG
jgi:hypothetical protein